MVQKFSKKPGLSPGTLVYVGDSTDKPVRISIIDYTPEKIEEKEDVPLESLQPFVKQDSVTWINISGVHDMSVIEGVGKIFDLHPLLLEDIVNTNHRAKLDEFDDYLFLVLKMAYMEASGDTFAVEHICLVVGQGFVISFQEGEEDVFNPLRKRLRKAKGRIRRSGSDYLAYALIDMVVDHYFVVLEQIGDEIENLQETVLNQPESDTLSDIQDLRHRIVLLRKSIWPQREILSGLLRVESVFIDEKIHVYFQDIYDHIIQVIDTVETNKDSVSAILDIYMSSLSNKMNEVMKVLTVIATLFIPLTFIAGIYGMNFKYMPELEWRYAYPFFWGVVITVLVAMVIWFKRKKWF